MPEVAQKIEIKVNNKSKTYCRKAFGISRFVYNQCVEKFTVDYKKYLSKKDEAVKYFKRQKNRRTRRRNTKF